MYVIFLLCFRPDALGLKGMEREINRGFFPAKIKLKVPKSFLSMSTLLIWGVGSRFLNRESYRVGTNPLFCGA